VFDRKDKGERDSLRKDTEMTLDSSLSYSRSFLATPAIAMLLASTAPQSSAPPQQPSEADVFPPDKLAPFDPTPERTTDSSKITAVTGETSAKQSKRILGIFPNYRAVSADTQLPQLTLRKKFWLATQDSFDYSSFITAGMLAGVVQAKNSTPEFGHGGAAYGRYYWHAVAGGHLPHLNPRRPSILHAGPRWIFEAQSLCDFAPADYTHRLRQ
jgi:hypothetical protein